MISALVLLVYAITAGTWGAAFLRWARWPLLAPRLAVAAWQALAVSVLTSVVASGAALAVSFEHVRVDRARLLDLCAQILVHGYAAPGDTALATMGLAATTTLIARTLWCAGATLERERRERRRQIATLDLVARPGIVPGALVVDHAEPFAFSIIGGRDHRVVLTSALLTTLTLDQRDAVLAHEATHVRQRHHLALLACRIAFAVLAPFFPEFRTAMQQVALYVELAADDQARRDVGAQPLHGALARLACHPAPTGALAASAEQVATRLRRLTDLPVSLATPRTIATGVTIGAMVLLPLVLVAAPAIALAWEGVCSTA